MLYGKSTLDLLEPIEESIFKRNDIIKSNGELYQCVCCESDIVIFAPIEHDQKEGCNVTHYKDMFAVGNLPSIIGNFQYERVK